MLKNLGLIIGSHFVYFYLSFYVLAFNHVVFPLKIMSCRLLL